MQEDSLQVLIIMMFFLVVMCTRRFSFRFFDSPVTVSVTVAMPVTMAMHLFFLAMPVTMTVVIFFLAMRVTMTVVISFLAMVVTHWTGLTFLVTVGVVVEENESHHVYE